jgi:hypothetical protein
VRCSVTSLSRLSVMHVVPSGQMPRVDARIKRPFNGRVALRGANLAAVPPACLPITQLARDTTPFSALVCVHAKQSAAANLGNWVCSSLAQIRSLHQMISYALLLDIFIVFTFHPMTALAYRLTRLPDVKPKPPHFARACLWNYPRWRSQHHS